jgi:hypothetical protein
MDLGGGDHRRGDPRVRAQHHHPGGTARPQLVDRTGDVTVEPPGGVARVREAVVTVVEHEHPIATRSEEPRRGERLAQRVGHVVRHHDPDLS